MRNRTWRLLIFGLVAVVCSFTLTLLAVPAVFELDGNPEVGTGQDWNVVNLTGGNSAAHTGAVPDMHPTPADQTAFFNRQTKDVVDLPGNWTGAATSVPDKDDLSNAYSASYVDPVTKHTIIVFGADRYSAGNGTAFLGFWFFQDPDVAPPPAGTRGNFAGKHVLNDLLVLVNFEGGGDTPNVKVLRWVPGAPDNLLAAFDGPSKCGLENGNLACAITNQDSAVHVTWPSAYKGVGSTQDLPPLAFFEGAVDLNAIFGNDLPCFNAFLAETRSSSSVTADLKDYVHKGFQSCSIGITKSCKLDSPDVPTSDGSSITYPYQITVTNTGSGAIYGAKVTDTFEKEILGDGTKVYGTKYFAADCTDLSPCDTVDALKTLAGGQSVTIKDSFTASLTTANNTATVVARPSPTGEYTVVGAPYGALCELGVTPGVVVTKECYAPEGETAVTLVNVDGLNKVKVNVKGLITNNSVGTDVWILKIVDNEYGVIKDFGTPGLKLPMASPNNTYPIDPFFYYPKSAWMPTCPAGWGGGMFCFSDTITVTYRAVLGDVTKTWTSTGTAYCPLCPPCGEPGPCPSPAGK